MNLIPSIIRRRLETNPAQAALLPDLNHCFSVFDSLGMKKGSSPFGDAFLYAYFHNGPGTVGETTRRSLRGRDSIALTSAITKFGFQPETSEANRHKNTLMMPIVRELVEGLKTDYVSNESSHESLWYLASMLQPFLYYTEAEIAENRKPRFDYYTTRALLGTERFRASPRWSTRYDDLIDESSYSFARSFLDNAFGKTSPFELPGSYVLTIEPVGDKLRTDLVSIPLIGSIRDGRDRRISAAAEFQYLEPWADSCGYKLSTLIGEFEELINSASAKEYDYQFFFQKNPEFLFLLGDYDDVRSQVSISLDIVVAPYVTSSKSRPDFMLHRLTDDTWDILELKKAVYQTPLMVGGGTTPSDPIHPSRVLDKAISQMKSYKTIFRQEQTRRYLQSKYSMNIVEPRLILLMGRNENFASSPYRRQLVAECGADLYTYDDLFKIADHRKLSKR